MRSVHVPSFFLFSKPGNYSQNYTAQNNSLTALKNRSEFQFPIDTIVCHSPKCVNVRIL